MTHAEVLLHEINTEARGTRNTLERIPANLATFQPHDKSMPMGKLAMHVATLPAFGAAILGPDMDLATAKFPSFNFESAEQAVRTFDQHAAELRGQLTGLSNEALERPWLMTWGDKVVAEGPRVLLLRSMFISHLVHHRAQLGVYLRLNHLPVPGLYGPSADDKMSA